uniref:Uncharacterized protein n=1 Tax=Zea mays TaxID=4577 RepID=A0A804R582_MAIZE
MPACRRCELQAPRVLPSSRPTYHRCKLQAPRVLPSSRHAYHRCELQAPRVLPSSRLAYGRIKDWRKVPTVVKSNLWEDVSKKFVMPWDETHTLNVKKVALKSMSHAWKDFKWKLNINYVKKDKTPFEDYPELKKEW